MGFGKKIFDIFENKQYGDKKADYFTQFLAKRGSLIKGKSCALVTVKLTLQACTLTVNDNYMTSKLSLLSPPPFPLVVKMFLKRQSA